jgi:hypothetical protein
MILLCGIPSEPPLELVARALDANGAPYAIFNQRQFATSAMSFEISGGGVNGWLEINGNGYLLDQIQGVYTRLMDYRRLPELEGVPESADIFRYCAALNDTMTRWCEISPVRIVNRSAPMGSNSSKPFQAQLIRRYGFAVPETLITNTSRVQCTWSARRYSRPRSPRPRPTTAMRVSRRAKPPNSPPRRLATMSRRRASSSPRGSGSPSPGST